MAKNIYLRDGDFVDGPDNLKIPALSFAHTFGFTSFTRFRFRWSEGLGFLLLGGERHVDRVLFGLRGYLDVDIAAYRLELISRLTRAVRASEYARGYGHLEVFLSKVNSMAKDVRGKPTSIIWIDQKPPMYGQKVHLASVVNRPRPDDPLVIHKLPGNYPPLMEERTAATRSLGERFPELPTESKEALFFARSAFRWDRSRAKYVLSAYDPLVTENAFANVGILKEGNTLAIPDPCEAPFFQGVCVQIAADLVERHLNGHVRRGGVCRSQLLRDAFATGTACDGVIPIRGVDEKMARQTGPVARLHELYDAFCGGKLDDPKLVRKWMLRIEP